MINNSPFSARRRRGIKAKRRSPIFLAAACAALTAGCSGGGAPPEPSRLPTIVSLNPCADAILAEVAAPDQLLAISHYSHDPRASSMDMQTAGRFAITGGTVEEVLALDPDVVVGSTFMAPATRSAFTNLGIRVETIGIASDVESSLDQVRQLADLAGAHGKGAALILRITAALDKTAFEGNPVPAVLWQPGGIVPGEGALVSALMEHTGFASHSAQRGLQQADYLALENMLADPPQVLLVAGQERAQAHPVLGQLTDLQTATFDPALLYCGGPTIIRAAHRLRAIRDSLAL